MIGNGAYDQPEKFLDGVLLILNVDRQDFVKIGTFYNLENRFFHGLNRGNGT
jgi:hypothetical protein